jgi:hypothetical protein
LFGLTRLFPYPLATVLVITVLGRRLQERLEEHAS